MFVFMFVCPSCLPKTDDGSSVRCGTNGKRERGQDWTAQEVGHIWLVTAERVRAGHADLRLRSTVARSAKATKQKKQHSRKQGRQHGGWGRVNSHTRTWAPTKAERRRYASDDDAY
jgi:hypothetical protein